MGVAVVVEGRALRVKHCSSLRRGAASWGQACTAS